MEMSAPTAASPPTSPNSRYQHQQRPSTASMTAMQRAKRSSSRITDGFTSRSSDEDSKTAVKVGMLAMSM